MNKQAVKYNEHIERCHKTAAEWFKNHEVSYQLKNPQSEADKGWFKPVMFIYFKRPNTWEYGIQFTIYGGYVTVTGDLGDAIYGFGCDLNLMMLQKFDWHYFIGKCCASETGREYTMKIPGVGESVPNIRAIAHYDALQMAISKILGAIPPK